VMLNSQAIKEMGLMWYIYDAKEGRVWSLWK